MHSRRPDLKKILTDPDLRRKLMVSTIRATQAREGIETTEEMANHAYYVVTEGEKAAFFDLQKYRGGKGEPDRRHEAFITGLKPFEKDIRLDVSGTDFLEITSSPLVYRHISVLARVFREIPKLDPSWGVALQGLATADDSRFLRCWWELPRQAGENDWIVFAKGGEFSRFYADTHLIIQWTNESRASIKDDGRLQNVDHYFKPGLTWPRRTQRGFNLRILPTGCIFADKGPAIFPNDPDQSFYILGVANSSAAECILRELMSFGSWEVGVVKRLPMPVPSAAQNEIIRGIARSIYRGKAGWDRGNEISTAFERPWLMREEILGDRSALAGRLDRLAEFESAEDARIQKLYAELNDEVYRLYGISDETRKVIEATLGERPPEVIWPQMEGKTVEQKRMEHVWRLLSYVVKRVVEADEDGIVPTIAVSGEASLLDRVYKELEMLFPGQAVERVEVEIVNELKRKVKGYRSTQSISEWLEDVFFEHHASLYKKRPIIWHIAGVRGRGRAAFGALVHYHKFDGNRMAKLRGSILRDALEFFRREAALAGQERRESDRIEWQSRLEEARELDRRLQLVEEGRHEGPEGGESDFRILAPWKSPAERPKGWNPDLDDGVKVNIEPLQKAGVLRISKVV